MQKGIILFRIWKSSDCSLTISQEQEYISIRAHAQNAGYTKIHPHGKSLEEVIAIECDVLRKKLSEEYEDKNIKALEWLLSQLSQPKLF